MIYKILKLRILTTMKQMREDEQLYIHPEENGRVARTELINERFAIHLFELN